MNEPMPVWQNAVARVELRKPGQRPERLGTAFLVSSKRALTALHVVVQNRRDVPLRFRSGDIYLKFRGHETKINVTDQYDAVADWALLELVNECKLEPLSLRVTVNAKDHWDSRGFPDANPEDGLPIGGTVRDPLHRIEGVSTLSLFCDEAAAGKGLKVKGFSGAPAVIDGCAVGILRRALLSIEKDGEELSQEVDIGEAPPRAEAGTLFACPIKMVLDKCGDDLVEEPPARRAPPAPVPAQQPVEAPLPRTPPPAPIPVQSAVWRRVRFVGGSLLLGGLLWVAFGYFLFPKVPRIGPVLGSGNGHNFWAKFVVTVYGQPATGLTTINPLKVPTHAVQWMHPAEHGLPEPISMPAEGLYRIQCWIEIIFRKPTRYFSEHSEPQKPLQFFSKDVEVLDSGKEILVEFVKDDLRNTDQSNHR